LWFDTQSIRPEALASGREKLEGIEKRTLSWQRRDPPTLTPTLTCCVTVIKLLPPLSFSFLYDGWGGGLDTTSSSTSMILRSGSSGSSGELLSTLYPMSVYNGASTLVVYHRYMVWFCVKVNT
jgi:hypothetical protein